MRNLSLVVLFTFSVLFMGCENTSIEPIEESYSSKSFKKDSNYSVGKIGNNYNVSNNSQSISFGRDNGWMYFKNYGPSSVTFSIYPKLSNYESDGSPYIYYENRIARITVQGAPNMCIFGEKYIRVPSYIMADKIHVVVESSGTSNGRVEF